MKIVIVPIPADVIAKVGDAAYQAGTIPAKTYEGQNDDVSTAAIQNFLVTHEGRFCRLETVYKMTKSMFDNLDLMVSAHAAAKGDQEENAIRACRCRCIPAPRNTTAKPAC